MIRCRICNKRLKAISHLHLRTHGLTPDEYKQQFPGAPTMCKASRKKFSKTSSTRMQARHDRGEMKQVVEAVNKAQRTMAARRRARKRAKRLWEDSSYRETQSSAVKKAMRRPETRALLSANAKKHRFGEKAKERWQDPEYRRRRGAQVSAESKQRWADRTEKERNHVLVPLAEGRDERWKQPGAREKASKQLKEQNKDPEFCKKKMDAMLRTPNAKKWYKEEKIVRGWLKDMGLYETGSRSRGLPGFLHHRVFWTGKFHFQADFADFNNQQIIHVDGVYWHSRLESVRRDRRVDRWCANHGWQWIRLTDIDINNRLKWCRNMIRRLVRGDIVPMVL